LLPKARIVNYEYLVMIFAEA